MHTFSNKRFILQFDKLSPLQTMSKPIKYMNILAEVSFCRPMQQLNEVAILNGLR